MEYNKESIQPSARIFFNAKEGITSASYGAVFVESEDAFREAYINIINTHATNTLKYKIEESFDGENWFEAVSEKIVAIGGNVTETIVCTAVKIRLSTINGTGASSYRTFLRLNPFGTI